jgi:lysozyme
MDIQLFERLAEGDEAIRYRVYDDATGKPIGPGSHVVGNPTIAVGRNVGPTGPGLRVGEVKELLDNDSLDYEAQASTFPWYSKLNPVRQTMVALMVFNMGLRRFGGFKKFHACAEAGDPEGMAREMLASDWAKPPPVGVGPRAERMAEMMRLGVAIAR